MRFDHTSAFYQHIKDNCPAFGAIESAEQAELLLAEISFAFENSEPPPRLPRGVHALIIPKIYWVIKNEDLPVIDSLLHGFATSAAVGFFAPGSADKKDMIAAAAGLISTCYKLYKSATTKGMFVSELDYKILLCLKNNPGGLDVQRIANLLNLTKQTTTIQELDQRLKSLQSMYTDDGSKRELVFIEDNVFKVRGL